MDAQSIFDRAMQALDAGELQRCEELAEQLAEAGEPLDAELIRLDVLLARGQGGEALLLVERALHDHPQDGRLLGAHATLLLDEFGDVEGADQDLRQALKLSLPAKLRLDLQVLHAEVLLRLERPEQALGLLDQAAHETPQAPDPHLLQGRALYELHRFDEALKALARAVDRDPRLAPAYYARGEVLDCQGDAAGAERAFARARELDPQTYGAPVEMDEGVFRERVREAIDELPERVAEYLHNVAIVVEDRPDLEQLRRAQPPLPPNLLGLFEGTPRPQESGEDPWSVLPKSIYLYRHNILRAAVREPDIADLISDTLLHEIGHFLGLDEQDLIDRGLK